MVQSLCMTHRPEFMLRKYNDPCELLVGLRANVAVVRAIHELSCSFCKCIYVPNSSLQCLLWPILKPICESIWRPSLTLTLLCLQICQKKFTTTAQEDHPQDSPQQAAHQQSVKETRVRSLTYYKTCKQIASTKKQRMIVGERKRNSFWREKRSVKA